MSRSTIHALTAGLMLLMSFAARPFAAESTGLVFEFAPETYVQGLEVEFVDEASAAKATLELLPLYDGYKATWYLNQVGVDCLRSATAKMRSDGQESLLEGGNSIGCHSLTHPMLGWGNRNRIFEEVAGCRMLWEAAANTCVVSFAAPFCSYMNDFDGDASLVDMGRALQQGMRGGLCDGVDLRDFNAP